MDREEISLEYFTHADRKKRVNCAQAIALAYHRDSSPLTKENLKLFKKYGVGRAPGKVCGAYYAAAYLLDKSRPDLKENFSEYFSKEAGSVICREIRRQKSLSCEGCVSAAARYMSQTFPKAI